MWKLYQMCVTESSGIIFISFDFVFFACLSVRPSMCHPLFTKFLLSHRRENFTIRTQWIKNNVFAKGHRTRGNCRSQIQTTQIWGIWKLRPAYSPETPNLGQNRWCFVLCDLEIWWMTLGNNRASLLCCFKLCVTFHSHRWIQTGVTVRKRPIWVKFDDF